MIPPRVYIQVQAPPDRDFIDRVHEVFTAMGMVQRRAWLEDQGDFGPVWGTVYALNDPQVGR